MNLPVKQNLKFHFRKLRNKNKNKAYFWGFLQKCSIYMKLYSQHSTSDVQLKSIPDIHGYALQKF